jgi:ketosteroid isomerase-like protein
MDSLIVVKQFVEAINSHDVPAIAALMTPGHRFIDSLGNVVECRQTMQEGWKGYFTMVPDYQLLLNKHFKLGESQEEVELVCTGTARGSYSSDGTIQAGSEWSTPVAVRALVRDGLVDEWQVYADNEPIRERMRAAHATD